MENTILIHDYFSSLPELEDPNTIESKCMLFIGQIGNTDFVEEVLTAIMNKVITFSEINALPSITIFTLTKLLESKDQLFNTMELISKFVAQKNILSLLINFHYAEVNFNYVAYLKYYMRDVGSLLPYYHEKVKLNTDLSIMIYKTRVSNFINLPKNQDILNKYRNYFSPETKMDEFIASLPVYTSNQLFNTTVTPSSTGLASYSVLQLALFGTHEDKIYEPSAHSAVIKKIESEMFQLLSTPEAREQFKAGTLTLQSTYETALKTLHSKLQQLVLAGNQISVTTQIVSILEIIQDTEKLTYIKNPAVVKYAEFMIDYANMLHALDEEVFNV